MDANQTKQIFGGVAVAALLIAPTLAHAGPLPPPPPPPPMVAPMPVAETGGWVTHPQQRFAVKSLRVDDFIGTLIVNVKPEGPMTLDVAGIRSRVDGLQISGAGDVLKIEGQHVNSVWNWHDWFNFSIHDRSNPKNLVVKVTVPKGADVRVDGLIGDATIGDTAGPLHFEAVASNAKIGKVGAAKLSLAGSGKVDVVSVDGPLSLEIAGSGKVHVGKSGRVKVDVAGAGDARFGVIEGGLKLDIAGSGDVAVDSVNGPVKIDVAGSGSVKIAQGNAKPFKVSIMGSGNIFFGGMAVDPDLTALGSGSVQMKGYSGHLSTSGSVTVKVDGKSVHSNDDDDFDDDN